MSELIETKGHLAASGGLRGHSIGDAYPLSIVGRGYDGWQVQNLESGEWYGTITSYENCEALIEYIKTHDEYANTENV